MLLRFFFVNYPATTGIYPYGPTLARPDALPIFVAAKLRNRVKLFVSGGEEASQRSLEKAGLTFLQGVDANIFRLDKRTERVADVVMRQQIDRIALQARRELAGVAQRRTFATLLVAGAHAAEALVGRVDKDIAARREPHVTLTRSEEHTSELQSLMRISYAVFCLKKKN